MNTKILVRGVNWLGDAVMTTPALVRLRERFPSAQITILTPEKLAALYLHHPAVDRVLAFRADESLLTIATWLRDEAFDLGVVLPNSPRSALELLLGRVRERVGYARPWRSWMLTHKVADNAPIARMRKRPAAEVRDRIARGLPRERYDAGGHHLHHYLRLVSALGCNPAPVAPVVHVTEGEVQAFCARFEIPPSALVYGLNAGAEYGPAKRWPVERFVAAALEIQQTVGCTWLVLGGPGDRALAEEVSAKIGARVGAGKLRNIAGQTSLRELAAALRRCRLLLTNDTGPMHVAAAVGTALVVPFGSTSPELTGPGLPGDQRHGFVVGEASCAPCFLRECPVDFRCMKNIEVRAVVEKALRLRY